MEFGLEVFGVRLDRLGRLVGWLWDAGLLGQGHGLRGAGFLGSKFVRWCQVEKVLHASCSENSLLMNLQL
jgi:hypothetical protein